MKYTGTRLKPEYRIPLNKISSVHHDTLFINVNKSVALLKYFQNNVLNNLHSYGLACLFFVVLFNKNRRKKKSKVIRFTFFFPKYETTNAD